MFAKKGNTVLYGKIVWPSYDPISDEYDLDYLDYIEQIQDQEETEDEGDLL